MLKNGVVLVAAGDGTGGLFKTAELYSSGNLVTTVDGDGAINGQDGPARFHFDIVQSGGPPTGKFIFSDPSAGISILKGQIRTLTITDNSANFRGRAHLEDGTPVNFEVAATDNGDGTSDTCSVSLNNGYTAGGNLIKGDVRILTQ